MKVLSVTYAFPPLQVPMSMVVYKMLFALKLANVMVDIVTVNFEAISGLQKSNFLVDDHFHSVHRLHSECQFGSFFQLYLTDPMYKFNKALYSYLKKQDLDNYDAIISFSPFHSINLVLSNLKKIKKFKWIAHFCDPWYNNPLEPSFFRNCASYFFEKKVVQQCDYLIHSCEASLLLMLKNKINKNSCILPHVFLKELYPTRPKIKNKKLVMRHIGTLIKERSPIVLLKVLDNLKKIFNNLEHLLQIDFIGKIDDPLSFIMLENYSNLINIISTVDYDKSIELMYDSDILLLIEGDGKKSLFLPSKLADYIGANNFIIGICPDGAARNILLMEHMPCVYHHEEDRLTAILTNYINDFLNGNFFLKKAKLINHYLSAKSVATKYIDIIKGL